MASDGRKQLQRWQELANEAAEETDPQKLIRIVKDLCSLLNAEKKPPASSRATAHQSQKSARK
ncbi:MAG: hypothetical protein DMG82_08740 [Acidobacteria bacterium]|nr:MAG: hypothetical protein DMG82_08740 [Acidobacteriota bacterium]PYX40880.1 MAG: hypothetical protein DMG83_25555 [Acidobacteriota bacterium]